MSDRSLAFVGVLGRVARVMSVCAARGALAIVALALAVASSRADDAPRRVVIDTCDDAKTWEIRAADGVKIETSVVPARGPGDDGGGAADQKALRIDYDFSRGSGYGIIRRAVDLKLPQNYRFTWKMRGEGPRNTLEFKLVEPEAVAEAAGGKKDVAGGGGGGGAVGENVWWVNQTNFAFPSAWTEMSLPKRKFSFAWGPSGGKPIETVRWIEIAITSFNGGKGTVWFDELGIEELPVVRAYDGVPVVSVSSAPAGTLGPSRIEADGTVMWTSHEEDVSPTITIDFGAVRSFGGLHVRWKPTAPRYGGAGGGATGASGMCGYSVQTSTDGVDWSTLKQYLKPGAEQVLRCPDTSTRYLRLAGWIDAHHVGEGPVTLTHLHVLPLEFADDLNGVVRQLALRDAEGLWPRSMTGAHGQGVYWTVAGTAHGQQENLFGEDGEVEIGKSGPSLHAFLLVDGQLLSWANAQSTRVSLREGFLPIPKVERICDGLTLGVECFADINGLTQQSTWVRYTVANTGAVARRGELAVAIRSLQVNPWYQFLNAPGGVAPIRSFDAHEGTTIAQGDGWNATVTPLTAGTFCATPIEAGEIVPRLAAGDRPDGTGWCSGASNLLSGAWLYPFDLQPGEERHVYMITGMHGKSVTMVKPLTEQTAEERYKDAVAGTAETWREAMSGVELSLPGPFGKQITDSVRANLAYILINKDGPGIQPGSRSYERTWIRDGTLTSAALLSFGFEDEVRAFLDWFAPFQYDNGKIPCCVDQRGPDPVAEHDSHGQYIHAVMRFYQHTHDAGFLARHYPHVLKAIEYMVFLRNQRTTDEYRNGPEEKRAFYGLLPESISHEGYSAKPMHSYWDMLFAVRGVSDARAMAELMNDQPNVERLKTLEREFSKSLVDSYTLAMKLRHIDYLPGCVELGDFDATSTTVALYPCDQGDVLPRDALVNTFEKFYTFFTRRRDGFEDWVNYTPYEHRIVGAMILLGWRERAHELWHWYFQHQRPAGWHHWAEVVWKDERAPKFIGDMPHTWVGSDFINSVRLMLAYERHADESLVLGAGLPLEWLLDSEGVKIGNLRTIYGTVSYRTKGNAASGVVMIDVDPMAEPPRGGVEFSLPSPDQITSVVINSEPVTHARGHVRIPDVKRATRIEVRYSAEPPSAP